MTVRGDETRERDIAYWAEGDAGCASAEFWHDSTRYLLAELAAARQENAQLREVYEAGQAVMDHWQLRIGGTRPLTAPEERFAAALAAVTGNEPREQAL